MFKKKKIGNTSLMDSKPGPSMFGLNRKQRLFLELYFKTQDEYQAYIEAGYVGTPAKCRKFFESDRIQNAIKNFLELPIKPVLDKEKQGPDCLGEEKLLALENNIRIGMSFTKAAKLVGITYRKFADWMRMGEMDYDNEKIDTAYYRFYYRIFNAKLRGEKERLEAIGRSGYGGDIVTETKRVIKPNGDIEETTTKKKTYSQWPALAWILERTDPEQYARKSSYTQDSPIEIAQKIKLEIKNLDESVPGNKKEEKSKTKKEIEKIVRDIEDPDAD